MAPAGHDALQACRRSEPVRLAGVCRSRRHGEHQPALRGRHPGLGHGVPASAQRPHGVEQARRDLGELGAERAGACRLPPGLAVEAELRKELVQPRDRPLEPRAAQGRRPVLLVFPCLEPGGHAHLEPPHDDGFEHGCRGGRDGCDRSQGFGSRVEILRGCPRPGCSAEADAGVAPAAGPDLGVHRLVTRGCRGAVCSRLSRARRGRADVLFLFWRGARSGRPLAVVAPRPPIRQHRGP
mmetsp:Transcript_82270/g.228999  ORF Transcript_82270/g.228999 Transcript_82270/m.228999 type:complete len:239 (-) Transcript_82270:34-750(-)